MKSKKLLQDLVITTKKDLLKRARLYKTYGITLTEWGMKFDNQNGVCWICKKLPPSGRLCVDHRHIKNYKKMGPEDKKKEVRGLLCFMCNTGLHGIEKRNNAREILEGIYKYFKVFKIKGDL